MPLSSAVGGRSLVSRVIISRRFSMVWFSRCCRLQRFIMFTYVAVILVIVMLQFVIFSATIPTLPVT